MRMMKADRLPNLALPAGASLILSALALVLFPRLATVACQFLAGLVLVGLFAARRLLRYARERRVSHINKPLPRNARTTDRGDVLVLIGVAALYIGISGSLLKSGWPIEAVRSCALFLLVILLLLRPRLTLWKPRLTRRYPVEGASSRRKQGPALEPTYSEVHQERI